MRSKEVDEAIDTLQNCIADYVIGDFCVGKYCPMENECKDKDCPFNTAIDKVVDYISELEKELERIKSLDIYKLVEDADTGQLIHKDKIRDKIKELEENRDKYVEENIFGSYMEAEGMIRGLKKIIGE